MGGSDDRRSRAMRLAVRSYFAQMFFDWRVSAPALLLPGVGGVLTVYLPPLIIAKVLVAFAGRAPGELGTRDFLGYAVLFGAAWLGGEVMWRIGIHFLNRTDSRGIERLYLTGMQELLAKDLAFFHDNFAGSLTKKVIGYAKSFEGFVDTFAFSIVANVLPLFFVLVYLWRYSPWLPITLVALAGGNDRARRPADPSPQALGRPPRGGKQRSRRPRRRLHLQHGSRAGLRPRAPRVRHPREERAALGPPGAAFVGLPEPSRRPRDHADVRAVERERTPPRPRRRWWGRSVARGRVRHVQLLRQRDPRDVGLQPHLPQPRDEPGRGGTVQRVVVGPADRARRARRRGAGTRSASVQFDAVTFTHPNSSGPLFQGLDLRVGDGERVGLIGRSGGGKTTITKLCSGSWTSTAVASSSAGRTSPACAKPTFVR